MSAQLGCLMSALLGEQAKGSSPGVMARLKEVWKQECQEWLGWGFPGKRYVHVGAVGVYLNVRLRTTASAWC